MKGPDRLREFVCAIAQGVEAGREEADMLAFGKSCMAKLIEDDGWLPAECAKPHPVYYQQHLLYADPLDRFSVVSFVWGPGQRTPIHNHTVWGIIGMLRGAEIAQPFERMVDGTMRAAGEPHVLQPGEIECVSPRIGDLPRVSNAHADQVSISIHLYGGNIGKLTRCVFDDQTGQEKAFVSGYSNAMTPNLWFKPASAA